MLGGSNGGYFIDNPSQTEGAPAEWHVWPCVRPEVVLQSYEYAGSAQSRFPSVTYSVFEGLISGTMDNDWEFWKDQMTRWGMVCLEDEGTVSVFDPDAPGSMLYGTLTNTNGSVQFTVVGYYLCTEEKEYSAEVWDMLSGAPSSWIDTHRSDTAFAERRVYTVAKLLDYLEGKEINNISDSPIAREQERIRTLMNHFVENAVANDREATDACLADGASGSDIGNLFDADVEIISYDNVPAEEIEIGETCSISLLLREVEDPAQTYRMDVRLVKQKDGWRILSCHPSE